MLHALGYLHPDAAEFLGTGPAPCVYDQEAVDAVNRFRSDQGWRTTVPGYLDARTIERLWSRLEEAGEAEQVRRRLLDILRVTR